MGRAPKYQQITEWIQNQIASGELSGGDRLESEYEPVSYTHLVRACSFRYADGPAL